MLIFIILSLLLAFVALLALAYPILSKGRSKDPISASAEETIDELLAQRDAVFQALRELRFDHEVGKITDEDYVVFEASLKQTAASSLRALDEWESGANNNIDAVIEAAVAARAVARGTGGTACPNCGHLSGSEDKFCGRCGAALPEAALAESACPKCGRPFEAGDRFCAGCGQPLGAER
jgi:RNA polymerase subunit RPABC4/transcription elongation factor Spt4